MAAQSRGRKRYRWHIRRWHIHALEGLGALLIFTELWIIMGLWGGMH